MCIKDFLLAVEDKLFLIHNILSLERTILLALLSRLFTNLIVCNEVADLV